MDEPDNDPVSPEQRKGVSGQDAYNIVSDTVTGANVRLKDNVLQAIVIAVCLAIGVAIGAVTGAILSDERIPGALGGGLAGGFLGLLVGLFGSGIFLMIFRMIQHLRGRHD